VREQNSSSESYEELLYVYNNVFTSIVHIKVFEVAKSNIRAQATKSYVWAEVQLHTFLIHAVIGGEFPALLPCRFTRGERAPNPTE
jgi:hypothetical protein